MCELTIVAAVLLLVDVFCYWAAVAVDGPRRNFWLFSGFYELYKTARRHW